MLGVLSIDFSKALELPGVVAIATGADAENKFGVLPVTKDEHAMAVEKVRHVGDLVACVAAEDEVTAREAERLIEVEYEILDSIHDMRDGLQDSELPIHDRGKYHIGDANIQKRVYRNLVMLMVLKKMQLRVTRKTGYSLELIMLQQNLMLWLQIGTHPVD